MTSTTEFRKLAKRHLLPQMTARGFSVKARKEEYYFRKVGEIYHVVWLEIGRAGTSFRAMAHATMPEVYRLHGENHFEKNFPAIGAFTGDYLRPDKLGDPYYWPCGTEAEAQESFAGVVQAVDRAAIPWFEKIVDRESLARAVKPKFQDYPLARHIPDLIRGKMK